MKKKKKIAKVHGLSSVLATLVACEEALNGFGTEDAALLNMIDISKYIVMDRISKGNG